METHGKGKPFTRVEPVVTSLVWEDFITKFVVIFNDFAPHIIVAWFLTNSKVEMMRPLPRRSLSLICTTDFAENILVIRKRELSEQYFHRVEILLFGAVVSFVVKVPSGEDDKEINSTDDNTANLVELGHEEEEGVNDSVRQHLGLHHQSYMVSSDYRFI